MLCTPLYRGDRFHNTLEKFHGVSEICLIFRMYSSALSIPASVADHFKRRLASTAYDVMWPSCRLALFDDKIKRTVIEGRAGPDMNSLKSEATAQSRRRMECYVRLNVFKAFITRFEACPLHAWCIIFKKSSFCIFSISNATSSLCLCNLHMRR